MPSKSRNANNPLGFSALGGAASLGDNIPNEIGRRSPRSSMDCGQVQMPNQVIVVPKKRRTASAGVAQCILGAIFADPANVGKKKLIQGYVSGGGANEVLVVNNLTPVISNHVYVIINWTAAKIDEVLQSGGTLDSVSFAVGATIPDDTLPTLAALAGIAHVPLGQWISDEETVPAPVWQKTGCGNIGIYYCPAQGFIYSRI